MSKLGKFAEPVPGVIAGTGVIIDWAALAEYGLLKGVKAVRQKDSKPEPRTFRELVAHDDVSPVMVDAATGDMVRVEGAPVGWQGPRSRPPAKVGW